MFEMEESQRSGANLKVVGIGGGGCNAVNTMIKSGLKGVEFIGANTDAQALTACSAPVKIQLGANLTKDWGPGRCPKSAGTPPWRTVTVSMNFFPGGHGLHHRRHGGGTGTGELRSWRDRQGGGALTVAVVTKPFLFEERRGSVRPRRVERPAQVRGYPDHHPQPEAAHIAGKDMSLLEAFRKPTRSCSRRCRGSPILSPWKG